MRKSKNAIERAHEVVTIIAQVFSLGDFTVKDNSQWEDVYVISHGITGGCTKQCIQNSRDTMAKWIKIFRKARYEFYYK